MHFNINVQKKNAWMNIHEYVCTYSSNFVCSTHICAFGVIALHVHENIA